jgi:hypothetical protein
VVEAHGGLLSDRRVAAKPAAIPPRSRFNPLIDGGRWGNKVVLMALAHAFLKDLIELKRSGAIDGFDKVIEIGAQQLADGFLQSGELLDELYGLFGRARTRLGTASAGTGDALRDDAPPSRPFWESLGFSYAAIDYDGHRDSLALDLNRDSVPDALKGTFQLAINTGTTEHIANQDNCFRVIHDLVGRRGVMVHEVPAGGHLNHGLINYNPKFFWALCNSNDYEMLTLKMCSWDQVPIPEDIAADNIRFGGGVQHIAVETVTRFSLRATIRKRNARAFESPLDLPKELVPLSHKHPWRGIRRLFS